MEARTADRGREADDSFPSENRQLAFQRLTQGRLEHAYRLASAVLRDEQMAQDAVHDAAVQAWTHWNSLRDQGKFDPWFDRIVVNSCRAQLRRDRAANRRALHPSLGAQDDLNARLAAREALRVALEAIPAEQRIVVVLRFIDDMPIKEVARLLNLREGTVKSRLQYGLRQLRAVYDATERL